MGGLVGNGRRGGVERILLDLDVIDSLCICQGCQEEPRNQDKYAALVSIKGFQAEKNAAK